ncbi:MAG: TRAM domain-containing protein [Vicinamibacterales bacterium]
MGVNPGAEIELLLEKPASGGRMIARHEGEVVLVAGGIPGERVLARITRAEKRVAFAEVVSVLVRSEDRKDATSDPACGGCLYSHIAYPRQVQLKAQIIEDAFSRIGKIPLADRVIVDFGSDRGYRMKARFHVSVGRAGFYREGTHQLCDPRLTGQLTEASLDAVQSFISALSAQDVVVTSVELSENIAADQRAMHVEVTPCGSLERALGEAIVHSPLRGATARSSDGVTAAAGDPVITDAIALLTGSRANGGILGRHPESFFQGNRFMITGLVSAVMDGVLPGRILDLYAGVGLFAVSLASAERGQVTAVEGDPVSGGDLDRNARAFGDRVRVSRGSVEAFLARTRAEAPDTLIVDPPRTGLSSEATDSIARSRAKRVVYVSCDPPTMARDARRLLDGGYRLLSLGGFDLFPNTPHVESLAVFELR